MVEVPTTKQYLHTQNFSDSQGVQELTIKLIGIIQSPTETSTFISKVRKLHLVLHHWFQSIYRWMSAPQCHWGVWLETIQSTHFSRTQELNELTNAVHLRIFQINGTWSTLMLKWQAGYFQTIKRRGLCSWRKLLCIPCFSSRPTQMEHRTDCTLSKCVSARSWD